MTPEEVSDVVAWLAGDGSATISGRRSPSTAAPRSTELGSTSTGTGLNRMILAPWEPRNTPLMVRREVGAQRQQLAVLPLGGVERLIPAVAGHHFELRHRRRRRRRPSVWPTFSRTARPRRPAANPRRAGRPTGGNMVRPRTAKLTTRIATSSSCGQRRHPFDDAHRFRRARSTPHGDPGQLARLRAAR